jgi:hypothetical protein
MGHYEKRYLMRRTFKEIEAEAEKIMNDNSGLSRKQLEKKLEPLALEVLEIFAEGLEKFFQAAADELAKFHKDFSKGVKS